MTNLEQLFDSSVRDIGTRCSLCQSQRILKSCLPKVVVQSFAEKDWIVGIPVNFSVMPNPVIALLDAENHAKKDGLIVGMDAQNDARTHVESATSL